MCIHELLRDVKGEIGKDKSNVKGMELYQNVKVSTTK